MKQFKNILLVLREKNNDKGIERAVDFAQKNDAQLTLIQPLTGQLRRIIQTFQNRESFSSFRAALLGKQREELKALCDSLAVKGVRGIVASGESAEEAIIKQVLRDKHDLLITTAQGESKSLGGLFRSLSQHLIRKCPCPVWIVHPEKPCQAGQVLAAVDPIATEDGDDTVDSQILEVATSLAHSDKAKLHVAHTYYRLELKDYEDLLNEYGLNIPKELHKKHVDSAIKDRKDKVEALLQSHDLNSIEHEVHLVEGGPRRAIPRIAEELKADVLVLGTVTRCDSPGHFIGTNSEDIINQVDCSVIAVKPLDFVSPVQL